MLNHQKHRTGEIFNKRYMWLNLGSFFPKHIIFVQIRTDDANIYVYSWIPTRQICLLSHTYFKSMCTVQIRADEAIIYLLYRSWLVRSGVLGRAPKKLWRLYSHQTLNCRRYLQFMNFFHLSKYIVLWSNGGFGGSISSSEIISLLDGKIKRPPLQDRQ